METGGGGNCQKSVKLAACDGGLPFPLLSNFLQAFPDIFGNRSAFDKHHWGGGGKKLQKGHILGLFPILISCNASLPTCIQTFVILIQNWEISTFQLRGGRKVTIKMFPYNVVVMLYIHMYKILCLYNISIEYLGTKTFDIIFCKVNWWKVN